MTIRIDPIELREAASYIGDRQTEVENAVSQLKQKIDEVGPQMEGEAITAFLEGFEEIYPTLSQKFPEVMTGIITQLNTIAQIMEEADEQLRAAMRG